MAASAGWRASAVGAAAVLVIACTGSVAGPETPPTGQGVNPAAPGEPGAAPVEPTPNGLPQPGVTSLARCLTPAVGASPLRRLTHHQYDNAVRDLLGAANRPGSAFAGDTQEDLFDSMATQSVSVLLADQYLEAAVHLAEGIQKVDALLGCDPAAGTCLRDFVKRFARRAFRRPLATDELSRLVALYDKARLASDATTGVRAVVAAVLSSPLFLFKPEFGAEASALPHAQKLTPFELSARLAWLLWASVPDDVLLDAAEAGKLSSPAQLKEQAQRMLADPRARTGLNTFYEQWLGLPLLSTSTKDAAVYPTFNDSLRSAMAEETRRFVEHVLWEGDGKLETLLTAPYSFVNGPLATLYGVQAPAAADSFTKVDLDPTQRSGLLTQASFLTTFASSDTSSPVKRGKWVRVRMLCQDLPEPPANVPPLPPPKEGISTRERFAMHTASPACSTCHKLIDGLGFGLERYDGIGAYRSMDRGAMVDARGQVTSTTDIDGNYDGGPALAALLAQSEQVRACIPTQWLRFGLGRREQADDACALAALQEAFVASDGDLGALLVTFTGGDAFASYRKPE